MTNRACKLIKIVLFASIITGSQVGYSSEAPNENKFSKRENHCRIATFNIRRKGPEKLPQHKWKNRLSGIIMLFKNLELDVIGLQEPTKEQIDDLANQLEDYEWFGKGRGESWHGYGTNEYNPIFFNKKSLTLLKKGTFHLNDWNLSWQSWLKQPHAIGVLPRICSWGLFEIKKTGHKFYVYNTHLDHKFATARLNQIKKIIDTIKQNSKMSTDEENIIIIGDLNTELNGAIQSILKKESLCDTRDLAKEIKGPRESATGWHNKNAKKIDHILIKKSNACHVPLIQQYVTGQYANQKLSDHRPVFVDIGFLPKNLPN